MLYAKWIDESKYCQGVCLIAKGDIREIHAKKDDDYILAGRDRSRYFGWVNKSQIEILENNG